MSEQATWIPLPKGRKSRVKIADALARVNRLAEWYRVNKPAVTRILVTKGDFKSIEESVGTNGITLNEEGMFYRGYRIDAVNS
jgi:hypothetical protein